MIRPILLVEDNPDDVFLFGYNLKAAGVRTPVEVFENSASAMRRFEEAARARYADAWPAMAFIDMHLPCISGMELLQWMRARGMLARVPVVIMSGSVLDGDMDMALREGAYAYVAKPGTPAGLAMLLHPHTSICDPAGRIERNARRQRAAGVLIPA